MLAKRSPRQAWISLARRRARARQRARWAATIRICLGGSGIAEILDRDEICGFRLVSASKAEAPRAGLPERGIALTHGTCSSERTTALAAAEAGLARGLPDGLAELEKPTDPDGEYTERIQGLMGAAGVVPFSGSMLAGTLGPATTVAVGAREGNVVAAAHGYLPHNSYSDYCQHA
jgi:hypothetical protein